MKRYNQTTNLIKNSKALFKIIITVKPYLKALLFLIKLSKTAVQSVPNY